MRDYLICVCGSNIVESLQRNSLNYSEVRTQAGNHFFEFLNFEFTEFTCWNWQRGNWCSRMYTWLNDFTHSWIICDLETWSRKVKKITEIKDKSKFLSNYWAIFQKLISIKAIDFFLCTKQHQLRELFLRIITKKRRRWNGHLFLSLLLSPWISIS